jgi:hypothetical protein
LCPHAPLPQTAEGGVDDVPVGPHRLDPDTGRIVSESGRPCAHSVHRNKPVLHVIHLRIVGDAAFDAFGHVTVGIVPEALHAADMGDSVGLAAVVGVGRAGKVGDVAQPVVDIAVAVLVAAYPTGSGRRQPVELVVAEVLILVAVEIVAHGRDVARVIIGIAQIKPLLHGGGVPVGKGAAVGSVGGGTNAPQTAELTPGSVIGVVRAGGSVAQVAVPGGQAVVQGQPLELAAAVVPHSCDQGCAPSGQRLLAFACGVRRMIDQSPAGVMPFTALSISEHPILFICKSTLLAMQVKVQARVPKVFANSLSAWDQLKRYRTALHSNYSLPR